MSVDYDAKLIVGFRVYVPENYKDVAERVLDAICNKYGYAVITVGSAYSGDLDFFIVPGIDFHNESGIINAIGQLDEMKHTLSQENIDFDPEPVVDARLHIW